MKAHDLPTHPLRIAMRARQLTTHDIAALCNKSPSTVRDVLNGASRSIGEDYRKGLEDAGIDLDLLREDLARWFADVEQIARERAGRRLA